uniref:Uncharacterized protein n=1 Tax=Timema genevievae TaxID=629358 RepID=A0A7R9K1B5_TIMGE|nr:unnamed protein product [Timema genevievae]
MSSIDQVELSGLLVKAGEGVGLDLAPYLDIKRETLTSPILLACMKDEKLFENDEQNLKPLFTNDLLNQGMNEITKEVQTPVTSLVPNVKVEVEETPVSTFIPNVKFEVELEVRRVDFCTAISSCCRNSDRPAFGHKIRTMQDYTLDLRN